MFVLIKGIFCSFDFLIRKFVVLQCQLQQFETTESCQVTTPDRVFRAGALGNTFEKDILYIISWFLAQIPKKNRWTQTSRHSCLSQKLSNYAKCLSRLSTWTQYMMWESNVVGSFIGAPLWRKLCQKSGGFLLWRFSVFAIESRWTEITGGRIQGFMYVLVPSV